MIVVWLMLAWIGGIAVILGGLMTVASLVLSGVVQNNWKGKLKLLGFSIGCTTVGFLILRVMEGFFPTLPIF